MRGPSSREMLAWISKSWDMDPDSLARMLQQNRRTIEAWLHDGRVSLRGGAKIRSRISSLSSHGPAASDRAAVDQFIP